VIRELGLAASQTIIITHSPSPVGLQ